MRKLFIIFLLIINSLFSFAYGQGVKFEQNNFIKNQQIINSDFKQNNIISVDFKNYENAVLRLNQNQEEISEILSQNNNKTNNPEYKHNRDYLSLNFYINVENIISFKSYNILSNLENEICTRAP